MPGAQFLKSGWAKVLPATAALLLAAAFASTRGSADAGALRVRLGGSLSETRVVVELDRSARGRLLPADDAGARRVVLALPQVNVPGELSGGGHGLVSGWRMDEAAGAARLRLDLRQDARVVRRFLLPPADGVTVYRYVIDLAPAGAAPVQRAAGTPARPSGSATATAPVRTSARTPAAPAPSSPAPAAASVEPVRAVSVSAPRRTGRRVIVIDAGHGGRDPGTSGASAREKDVTLAAALALKARLERSGRYRVVLTRSSDVYVPLEQRVRIARRAEADLFISLHADAGTTANLRGASVYTLSDRGSDRVAQRVMSGRGGFTNVQLPGSDRSVNEILLDLTQRATKNQSAAFAEMLLNRVDDDHPVLRGGHRNAGFVVLLAPDVPAVLLEMGFMTNAQDERVLANARARRRLMDAVGDAIDRYFAGDSTLASL